MLPRPRLTNPGLDVPKPLVSIVTPSFNQAAFIGDTLRSVADQDYQHMGASWTAGPPDGSVELNQEHAPASSCRMALRT